jgi:hypothetical protein
VNITLKKTLRVTGIVIGSLIVVALLALARFDWNSLKHPIERIASAKSGRTAEFLGVGVAHPAADGAGHARDERADQQRERREQRGLGGRFAHGLGTIAVLLQAALQRIESAIRFAGACPARGEHCGEKCTIIAR